MLSAPCTCSENLAPIGATQVAPFFMRASHFTTSTIWFICSRAIYFLIITLRQLPPDLATWPKHSRTNLSHLKWVSKFCYYQKSNFPKNCEYVSVYVYAPYVSLSKMRMEYTFIHTHYTRITHTHTHTRLCMWVCVYMYMYMYMYIYIYIYIHIYLADRVSILDLLLNRARPAHVYIYACVSAHVHVDMFIRTKRTSSHMYMFLRTKRTSSLVNKIRDTYIQAWARRLGYLVPPWRIQIVPKGLRPYHAYRTYIHA